MKLPYTHRFVMGLQPITPNSSAPARISMKNVLKMTVLIAVANTTTVTGSAITLKQAKDVSGTGEKALSFSKMQANVDTGASDAMVETTVASDTFTTTAVNNKNAVYAIDVPPDSLDTNNGFDCVRVGTGNATAQILSVVYILELKDGAQQTASVLAD